MDSSRFPGSIVGDTFAWDINWLPPYRLRLYYPQNIPHQLFLFSCFSSLIFLFRTNREKEKSFLHPKGQHIVVQLIINYPNTLQWRPLSSRPSTTNDTDTHSWYFKKIAIVLNCQAAHSDLGMSNFFPFQNVAQRYVKVKKKNEVIATYGRMSDDWGAVGLPPRQPEASYSASNTWVFCLSAFFPILKFARNGRFGFPCGTKATQE